VGTEPYLFSTTSHYTDLAIFANYNSADIEGPQ